jgi:hypothetical protein
MGGMTTPQTKPKLIPFNEALEGAYRSRTGERVRSGVGMVDPPSNYWVVATPGWLLERQYARPAHRAAA